MWSLFLTASISSRRRISSRLSTSASSALTAFSYFAFALTTFSYAAVILPSSVTERLAFLAFAILPVSPDYSFRSVSLSSTAFSLTNSSFSPKAPSISFWVAVTAWFRRSC